MTYPGGGPGGYPGQGPQQPQPGPYGQPPQSNPLSGVNLPVLLALGVTLLGVVAYFIGFSDEASGVEGGIQLMLVAGLLAVFRAVPNGPKYFPVAAVLSVVAGLGLLDSVIGVPEGAKTPGVVVVLLIMGILQMGVAVVALLFDLGVLKVPTPAPHYGPPSGQFPQQPPPGQYGQQYPQQPGQYPPPGQPGQPGPQHPGTPPGGYPSQG
jgi:Family of unknown function (DUF5336)